MALVKAFSLPLVEHEPVADRAAALNARYARWRTRDVLADLAENEFGHRMALVSSFGADSVVLLHLAASVDPGLPVVFIDSLKMFGSTLRYRDELVERLQLTDVRVAQPDAVALAQRDPDSALWLTNPDLCCAIRKAEPLSRTLAGFDAWLSGRKRYQGGERATLPLVEAEGERIKINPLADWSKADLVAYRTLHDLPEHPLVADGFRSIGCMPCTTRVSEGEDERDGRWRGKGKTECGIHFALPSLETDGSGI